MSQSNQHEQTHQGSGDQHHTMNGGDKGSHDSHEHGSKEGHGDKYSSDYCYGHDLSITTITTITMAIATEAMATAAATTVAVEVGNPAAVGNPFTSTPSKQ